LNKLVLYCVSYVVEAVHTGNHLLLLLSANLSFGFVDLCLLGIRVTTCSTFLNLFAVLSDGTGWGCVSEHGEKSYNACESALEPRDWDTLSDMEYCQ